MVFNVEDYKTKTVLKESAQEQFLKLITISISASSVDPSSTEEKIMFDCHAFFSLYPPPLIVGVAYPWTSFFWVRDIRFVGGWVGGGEVGSYLAMLFNPQITWCIYWRKMKLCRFRNWPVHVRAYIHMCICVNHLVCCCFRYDVELYQRIEYLIGKQLPEYPTEKNEVMQFSERVFEAQRISKMVRTPTLNVKFHHLMVFPYTFSWKLQNQIDHNI